MSVQLEQLSEICDRRPGGQREHLIPMLQEAQDSFGYLSPETMQAIAAHLRLPTSKVFGVATFYNQFRFSPKGRVHCQVCRGTACHVRGSARVLDALCQELRLAPGETTKDGRFSVEVVACIGACGLAPVVTVNGEFHAGVTVDKVKKLVKSETKRLDREARIEVDDERAGVG